MIERMKQALQLDPAATAVVTIDCQRGNLEPAIASLPVPESECRRVIEGTNRLLAMARRADIPIVHVTTVYEAPLLANHPFERAMLELKESFSPHASSDFARHKSPGSIEGEIVPALNVHETDLRVDSKRTFDAFTGTPLELLLRFMKRDTLVFAGCNTNTCVLATTFGAYNRGFRAIVVSDLRRLGLRRGPARLRAGQHPAPARLGARSRRTAGRSCPDGRAPRSLRRRRRRCERSYCGSMDRSEPEAGNGAKSRAGAQ